MPLSPNPWWTQWRCTTCAGGHFTDAGQVIESWSTFRPTVLMSLSPSFDFDGLASLLGNVDLTDSDKLAQSAAMFAFPMQNALGVGSRPLEAKVASLVQRLTPSIDLVKQFDDVRAPQRTHVRQLSLGTYLPAKAQVGPPRPVGCHHRIDPRTQFGRRSSPRRAPTARSFIECLSGVERLCRGTTHIDCGTLSASERELSAAAEAIGVDEEPRSRIECLEAARIAAVVPAPDIERLMALYSSGASTNTRRGVLGEESGSTGDGCKQRCRTRPLPCWTRRRVTPVGWSSNAPTS